VKRRSREAVVLDLLLARSGAANTDLTGEGRILKIMETTRHKSVDVLAAYVRRVDLFKDHAGATFL
jgi:hypothetical protein